jgi:hypothetical protein
MGTKREGSYPPFYVNTVPNHSNRTLKPMKLRILAPLLAIAVATGWARAQAKYLPGSNNAALRYWAAIEEMRDNPLTEESTHNMLLAVMKGETPWNEEKMGPILDVYADSIQTMQRGTKLPDCNWGLDYQLGNLNVNSLLMRSRGLEQLNTVEGVRLLMKGHGKTAVETWRAGIRFSQDLGRSGPVINALVASAILMDELNAMANYAGPGKLPEAGREELYAAVKAMPEDGFDWGVSWGVETAIGEKWFRKLRDSDDPGAYYKRLGMSVPKGVPPSQQDVEKYSKFMLAAEAALREPPGKAKPLLEDWESRKRKLSQVLQLQIGDLGPLSNKAREKVAETREHLLQALSAK